MKELLDVLVYSLAFIGVLGLAAWVESGIVKNSKKIPENLTHDQKRQVYNILIMKQLLKYVEQHPSQRFGQILRNVGILTDVGVRDSSQEAWETPDYYIDRILLHEEPWTILERMEKVLANEYDYDIVVKQRNK